MDPKVSLMIRNENLMRLTDVKFRVTDVRFQFEDIWEAAPLGAD